MRADARVCSTGVKGLLNIRLRASCLGLLEP
jgi:hypothetical protein